MTGPAVLLGLAAAFLLICLLVAVARSAPRWPALATPYQHGTGRTAFGLVGLLVMGVSLILHPCPLTYTLAITSVALLVYGVLRMTRIERHTVRVARR